MRICLLTTQDLDADPFPDDDWPCDPRPFISEAEWHAEDLTGQDSPARLDELAAEGFDVFFNLCDAAADEDRPGVEVVLALEELGVPFTGADSRFFEPTRPEMKQACVREGIPTPAYVLAKTEKDVAKAAKELAYPQFVKHHSSYASISLSRMSRVTTPAGLARQSRKIMSRHSAALIEEYVDGPEYTVLVAEDPAEPDAPTTYQPMQFTFPAGEAFKHSDLKWVDYEDMGMVPVTDPELDAVLRDYSARFFRALGGVGFGRCDLRLDPDGNAHMLEINPNCGVFYPAESYGAADACLDNDPAGHEGFARQLIAAALARQERRSPA
ncbi:MAG: D-alanine--D-alanine ligase [Acidimicrobiia bacterium]|nr:D-alanine--D-alanine ligase [Acidimicrobiia bacterium]